MSSSEECINDESHPLIHRALVFDSQALGSEDSWSEDVDEPEDSEEEEYVNYGEDDDASYDDEIILGMDEDYESTDDEYEPTDSTTDEEMDTDEVNELNKDYVTFSKYWWK